MHYFNAYVFYSYLNASIGSNLEALIAGYIPEITPTNAHKLTPIVIHNQGTINPTLKNILTILPSSIPRITPAVPPIRLIITDSVRNCRLIVDDRAPNALLTPISRVRSATE